MKYLISILIILLAAKLDAQLSKGSLQSVFRKMDSVFFERGFNKCDLPFLESAIHPEFVFYHDKHGSMTRSEFLDDFKKSICPAQGPKPVRKVDVTSLEVFPLYENNQLYAVIQ